MSAVPYTTQLQTNCNQTQSSQETSKFVIVRPDGLTERQSTLIATSQAYLLQKTGVVTKLPNEFEGMSSDMKLFVIPSRDDRLIEKIRSKNSKALIYLPRAVIEARGQLNVTLLPRKLLISLTMFGCKIFLAKSSNKPELRKKIDEMGGTILANFENECVVITDRADDRYSMKASRRGIPVVTEEWVHESYRLALDESFAYATIDQKSTDHFCADSLIQEYRVKPFTGLCFKISPNHRPNMKSDNLLAVISRNGGKIIFANERNDKNPPTHILRNPRDVENSVIKREDCKGANTQALKIIDEEFLEASAQYGYYLPKNDYEEIKQKTTHHEMNPPVFVKQERLSPSSIDENLTPLSYHPPSEHFFDGRLMRDEQQSQIPQMTSTLRQPDDVNDMILRALSNCEPPQSQMPSTQMRRLPERELHIEQAFEPSQQLFWNDSSSRRG